MSTLDLVIPAHNEADRLDRTLGAYRGQLPSSSTIRVALDGCTDATADVVAEHCRRDRRVRLHTYPKLGKGGVLMETFRRCDADLVGFVDADGSTPPSELRRLTDVAATADGAIASRRHPSALAMGERSMARRVTSSGFAFGTRRLFGLPYADTQCGAKVVRRCVLDRVLPLLSSRDFLFDVDLLLVARQLGFDIVEVPTVWVDQPGSKLRAGRDARRMLVSSLRLWLHHRVLPVDAAPAALAPVADPFTVEAVDDRVDDDRLVVAGARDAAA